MKIFALPMPTSRVSTVSGGGAVPVAAAVPKVLTGPPEHAEAPAIATAQAMQRRLRSPSLLKNCFLPCPRVLAATSDLIVVPADLPSCGLVIIGQKLEGIPWVARETSCAAERAFGM